LKKDKFELQKSKYYYIRIIMKLRIKFSKHGSMKFIGHLDIMRYFQKAIRRAEIDVVYTEGFSPHQKMSFAAPLGLGLYSNGEYFDVEVGSITTTEDVLNKLNAVMNDEIEVRSVVILPDNAKKAMSMVGAADYTVSPVNNEYDFKKAIDSLNDFYGQSEIVVLKKTKKSEKEVDIKPLIMSLCADENCISMRVSQGSENNLKPELVVSKLYEFAGVSYNQYDLAYTREDTLSFNEDLGEYVGLDKFGV